MTNQKRVVVCATGFKGIAFVKASIARGMRIDCIVSYTKDPSSFEDFERLREIARFHTIEWIETTHPAPRAEDLTLLVGWQFLLRDVTPSTIVFHDSLLPRYRGFAPTVTALIRGDTEIGVTALMPSGELDAGPVVAQRSQTIEYPIKIETALRRQVELMADIAAEIVQSWRNDTLVARAQSEDTVSFSIWRDDEDYEIDWTRDAASIERFVNALGPPYEGARTIVDRMETIRIADAVALPDLSFEIRDVGKIWKIENGCPVIICGSGLVRISNCHRSDGSAFEFKRLRMRVGSRRV